jgi:hypothetical protein
MIDQIEYVFVGPYIEEAMLDRRPWICFRVKAYLGTKRIGHLRIEWVEPTLVDQYFPTFWHYMNEMHGWCLWLRLGGPEGVETNWSDEILFKTWEKAHRHARTRPASSEAPYWQLSEEGPSREEMLQDLIILEGRLQWQFNMRRNLRPNYAYVGYVFVEEDFRRYGIATKMYSLAAMWLAVYKNLSLHASGLQSDTARLTWESLYERGFPVHRERGFGQRYVNVLDYTDNKRIAARKIANIPYESVKEGDFPLSIEF